MLSLLGSILFSCGFDPYSTNYGNGYFRESDKEYGFDFLSYQHAKTPNKDSIITFYDTLGNIVTKHIDTSYKGIVVVEQFVEDADYNDSIIVIKQKPKDKFYEEDTLYYLDEYNRFKTFDYHEYWIIKTNTNDVYGPLSLNQYHNYCVKLGMPEKFRVLFDDGEPTFLTRIENTFLGDILWIVGSVIFLILVIIICSPIVALFIVIRKSRRRNRDNSGVGILK